MDSEHTRIIQRAKHVPEGFRALVPGIHRGSTVVFQDSASYLERNELLYYGYPYGQTASPTLYELTEKIADLEGGGYTILTPSGQAASVLIYLAVLQAGDHVLVPSSSYTPTIKVLQQIFTGLGIETAVYDPRLGARIDTMLQPTTKLVWTESPGSNTFIMQDIPAIAKACREAAVPVAMDNTWATPLGFRPLDHDVTFSVQALTKYVGGHSDILMGSITVRDEQLYRRLRETAALLGYYVTADECFLTLRGLGTLPLRLERHQASALAVAGWLQEQACVAQVNYPPLPTDAGHALWKRDYSVGSGLLSFSFRPECEEKLLAFIDKLSLFHLGVSWGGLHSLVSILPDANPADDQAKTLVRLHIGIESTKDLIQDLHNAMETFL